MRARIVGGASLAALVVGASVGVGSCSSDPGQEVLDSGVDAASDAPGDGPLVDAASDAPVDASATDARADADGGDGGVGPIPHGLCHPTSGFCWAWPRPFADAVVRGCTPPGGRSLAVGIGALFDEAPPTWTAVGASVGFSPSQIACGGGADPYAVVSGGVVRHGAAGWVSASVDPDREGKVCGSGFYAAGGRFTGVWAVAPNDVWATSRHTAIAGCAQAFYRYSGAMWTRYDVPEALVAGPVYGAASNDVWTVGASFVHWDGAAWSEVTSPSPGTQYAALHGSGASNVWAVGKGGAIARWNGAAWSVVASPVADDLVSVFVASPTRAWATGGGKLLVWDGVSWSVDGSTASLYVNGVWGTGPTDLWIGASPDGAGTYRTGDLLHGDGVAWKGLAKSAPTTAQSALYGLMRVADDDVWSFGDTTVHFDGREAKVAPLPGDVDGWKWSARGGTAWVIGADRLTGARSLSRWSGGAWSVVAPPVSTGKRLDDVAADAAGHTYATLALGEAGPGYAIELFAGDGVTWSAVPATGRFADSLALGVLSMFAAGPGDLWLITRDARLHHLVGGVVTTFDATLGSNEASRILGIFGGNVYVFNTVLGTLKFDGAAWSTVTPELGADYYTTHRIEMVSPTEIWLVLSETGVVRRFDGATWSDAFALPQPGATSLAVDSRGTFWVAGTGGLFRRPGPGVGW